jgi:hypothetical protein
MSFMHIDNLTPVALVTQYIVESKRQGPFLSREDIELIERWLTLASNKADTVILTLEPLVERRLKKIAEVGRGRLSLKSLDKSVTKNLTDLTLIKK